MNAGWLAVPRGWLNSIGEIFGFSTRVAGLVYTGRVFQFFGEALRQTGILILGSTIVIWGLVFILGLQCGIEGAYFTRAQGPPAYAGVFAAWCDLREVIPYAFGYMLAAKVGTGIVAELGAMRITDEIDALEVMGVPPVTFLAPPACWPPGSPSPLYIWRRRDRLLRQLARSRRADRRRLLRRLLPDLLDVPEPPRPLIQLDQGHGDGDRHRARRLLLRLHGIRRAGRSGNGDREVDGPQHRARAHHRHDGNAGLLGRKPEGAHRGLGNGRRECKDFSDADLKRLEPETDVCLLD